MSNNLWWSYDPDGGSFSALPAGPMLLPALGVFAIIAVRQAFKELTASKTKGLGYSFINSDYYQSAKRRQDYLIDKKIDGLKGIGSGLTLGEQTELTNLQHPAFNNGGRWSF